VITLTTAKTYPTIYNNVYWNPLGTPGTYDFYAVFIQYDTSGNFVSGGPTSTYDWTVGTGFDDWKNELLFYIDSAIGTTRTVTNINFDFGANTFLWNIEYPWNAEANFNAAIAVISAGAGALLPFTIPFIYK